MASIDVFSTALEGRLGGMCDGPQGYNSRKLFTNTYSNAMHA